MGVFRVLQDIGDVHCAALHRHTTVQTAAARREWMSDDELLCLLRKAVRCDQVVHVVALAEHIRLVGATEVRHSLDQRVENRLEIDGGTANDLEYVCCCSDCHNSLSNRAFSIAITACFAKLLTSSICLSENGRTSWR